MGSSSSSRREADDALNTENVLLNQATLRTKSRFQFPGRRRSSNFNTGRASMDVLRAFCPAIVPNFFTQNPGVLPLFSESPICYRFPGALLFVDMSGFTPLTERLSREGLKGVERLQQHLNEYFGGMVELIRSFGGDVVKFVGDALLVLFCDQHEDNYHMVGDSDHQQELQQEMDEETRELILQDSVARACQCALAVHAKFHGYEAVNGLFLKLHSAVSCGQLAGIHVGGHFVVQEELTHGSQQRWEFVLKGQTIKDLAIASSVSKHGEIVLTKSAMEVARMRLQTKPVQLDAKQTAELTKKHGQSPAGLTYLEGMVHGIAPQPLPLQTFKLTQMLNSDLLQQQEDLIRREMQYYIPQSILPQLHVGHAAFLSELRNCTVLFLKLPEQDFDHPDPGYIYNVSLAEFQLVVTTIQGIVEVNQGHVRQLVMDDKATVMILVFGLLASEDTAGRGVNAALRILERMEEMNLPMAIGITTGEVFCGTIGNEHRREYCIVGDTVNTSARLMGAVKEKRGVLACEKTMEQIKAASNQKKHNKKLDVIFEELEPIALKGKAKPVPVYRPSRTPMAPISLVKNKPYSPEDSHGMIGHRQPLQKALKHLIATVNEARHKRRDKAAHLLAGNASRAIFVQSGQEMGTGKFMGCLFNALSILKFDVCSGRAIAREEDTMLFPLQSLIIDVIVGIAGLGDPSHTLRGRRRSIVEYTAHARTSEVFTFDVLDATAADGKFNAERRRSPRGGVPGLESGTRSPSSHRDPLPDEKSAAKFSEMTSALCERLNTRMKQLLPLLEFIPFSRLVDGTYSSSLVGNAKRAATIELYLGLISTYDRLLREAPLRQRNSVRRKSRPSLHNNRKHGTASRRSLLLHEVSSQVGDTPTSSSPTAVDAVLPLQVFSNVTSPLGSPIRINGLGEETDAKSTRRLPTREESASSFTDNRPSLSSNRRVPSRASIISNKAADGGMTPHDREKYKVRRKRRRQLNQPFEKVLRDTLGDNMPSAEELKDLKRHRLCFFIEDLHYADSTTIEVISTARERFPDIMWVLSMRNMEEEADALMEMQEKKAREERDTNGNGNKNFDRKSHISTMRSRGGYEDEMKFHYVSSKTPGLPIESYAFLQSRKATFFRTHTGKSMLQHSKSSSRLLTSVKGLSVNLQKRHQYLYNLKQSVLAHPRTVSLELDSFSEADVLDYIILSRDVDGASRDLVAYVYDNSGGVPAYVNALLDSLEFQNALTVTQKPQWMGNHGFQDMPRVLEYRDDEQTRNLHVPQSLQSTIVMNIDHLDPTLQLVVKVCAALHDFTQKQLEHCYPVETDGIDFAADLAALVKKSFLGTQTGSDGEINYTFKSLVLRTVAYQLLPFSYRKSLHEKCALFLRTQSDLSPHPKAALIAYHWQQVIKSSQQDEKYKALALQKSVESLQEAAEHSINNGASAHRAFDFLRTALELLDELPGKMTKVRLAQRAEVLTAFIPVSLAVKGPTGTMEHVEELRNIPHLERDQEFLYNMVTFLHLDMRAPLEKDVKELARVAFTILNEYREPTRTSKEREMALLSCFPIISLHLKRSRFASACKVGNSFVAMHRSMQLAQSVLYTGFDAVAAAYGMYSLSLFGAGQLEEAVLNANECFQMVESQEGSLAGLEGALWASATYICLGEWKLLLSAWDDAAGLLALRHTAFEPHKGVLQMWYMTLGIVRLGLRQRALKHIVQQTIRDRHKWEHRNRGAGLFACCASNTAAQEQHLQEYEDKVADLRNECDNVEAEVLENLTAIPEVEMQQLKSLFPAPFLKYLVVFVAYYLAEDSEDGLTAVEEWKRAVAVNPEENLSSSTIFAAQGQLLAQASIRFANTSKSDTELNERGKVQFKVEIVEETDSTMIDAYSYEGASNREVAGKTSTAALEAYDTSLRLARESRATGIAFRAQVFKCQLLFSGDRMMERALRHNDASHKRQNLATLQELYRMIMGNTANLNEEKCRSHTKFLKQLSLVQRAEAILLKNAEPIVAGPSIFGPIFGPIINH